MKDLHGTSTSSIGVLTLKNIDLGFKPLDVGIKPIDFGRNWGVEFNKPWKIVGGGLSKTMREMVSSYLPGSPLYKIGADVVFANLTSSHINTVPVIDLLGENKTLTIFQRNISQNIQSTLGIKTGFSYNSSPFQFSGARAVNESISSMFFGSDMQPWRKQNGLGVLETLPLTTVDIAQIIENIANLRESGQLDEEAVEATIAQAPEIEFPESLLPLYGELDETSEKVADVVLYLSSAQFMLYMICTLITAGTPPVLIATLLMSFLRDPWSQLRAAWKREE